MDDASLRILDAICTGNLVKLKADLKVPAHRSLEAPEGKTLLHLAAECGHPAIVAYLLESGWLVNAVAGGGETPLHFAARAMIPRFTGEQLFGVATPWEPGMPKCTDDIEQAIIRLVRSRGMAAPDSIGEIDDLPTSDERWKLYDVILDLMDDRVRLRQELLAAGISFDPDDPTFRFIRHGDSNYLKVVGLLIEHGANVNAMDERGESPLSQAVGSNALQIAECLLLNKADPNLKLYANGRLYSSPMENAVDWNASAAALLYRFGGQVDFVGGFPLHNAAGNAQPKTVIWLLEIGGDINQRAADGDTPLLRAAAGHEEVIAALCERGADLTVVNNKGQGVLHLAANWAPALKYFLKRGLNINAPDKTGLTPLHHAAQGASDEAIPFLLSDGANVNAQDDNGNTPLHIIFFGEEFRPDIEFPTFKALVDGGADKTIKNKEGETPYDLAKKHRYPTEYLDLLATS